MVWTEIKEVGRVIKLKFRRVLWKRILGKKLQIHMLQGCKNRMCVTKDENELSRLYQSLSLYAADLFRMNLRRIRCSQD